MASKKKRAPIGSEDKKTLKAFGRRLREIRDRKKLTVYDVTGDDMPIKTRQHWQSIERGEKNINLTTLFKIARSLEISFEDLVRDID